MILLFPPGICLFPANLVPKSTTFLLYVFWVGHLTLRLNFLVSKTGKLYSCHWIAEGANEVIDSYVSFQLLLCGGIVLAIWSTVVRCFPPKSLTFALTRTRVTASGIL